MNLSSDLDSFLASNWHDWSQKQIDIYLQTTPFSTGQAVTIWAQKAYLSVLAHVGASIVLDSVNARIINDGRKGTDSKIDSKSEQGECTTLNC